MNLYNIQLKHDIQIQPRRENNQLIMPSLVALQLSTDNLKACNHCRMFLKAIFLSDLVTGDRRDISEEAWNGHQLLPGTRDTSWPIYGKPPHTSWRIWQYCIRRAVVVRGRHLWRPLGPWLCFDNTWPWYLTPEGALYKWQAGNWYYHPVFIKRRRPLPFW